MMDREEHRKLQLFEGIDRAIDDPGWMVMAIPDAAPPFCYTVGLIKSFNHPEIIILGLRYEIAHPLLNTVGFQIKQGEVFSPGNRYDSITEKYDTQFVEVTLENISEYFGILIGYTRHHNDATPIRALQLVWPDPQNRFPWENGFEEKFRTAQPLLNVVAVP